MYSFASLRQSIVLFAIFLFFTTSLWAQNENLTEKFEDKEFSVQFPKGWRVHTTSPLHVLILYPTPIGDSYDTSINFYIMQEESKITDLPKYAAMAKNGLEIRTDVQSQAILESANGKCIRFDFTMDFNNSTLYGFQYRFIKEDIVYSLSFSGEEKSYQYYKNVADKVIQSFRFK